jgi:hypothetical protein
MSFAFQKRTLAFYISKQNAQISQNPLLLTFSEKVCKSGAVFAHNSGTEP